MLDKNTDQTPFDELVSEPETPGNTPPAPRAAVPARSTPQSTGRPRRGIGNIIKPVLNFLNAVRWPSPTHLPTGTLVGLSMTAGALIVLVCSVLLQYILPRPQSRFKPPTPVALKARPPAPAQVEITPGTAAIEPTASTVVHRVPADAVGAADVIKDPEQFEFDQKLAEQRRLENEKLAEARKLEDQKLLEQRRLEDQKLLEQQRLEEDQQRAAERKIEDEKLAAERKLADEKIAAARQRAEARKLEFDQKVAEARKLEDQRRADQRKLEDEKLAGQRLNEDQQRQQANSL